MTRTKERDHAREQLLRESAWRAQSPRLWYLLPEKPGPWRPWIAGALAAGGVLSLYGALTAVAHGGAAVLPLLSDPSVAATAAFFVASLGLLAGLAQIVFPAARRDLADLIPLAAVPADALNETSEGLARLPRTSALISVPIALTFAAVHQWLLGPSTPDFGPRWAGGICNGLLWVAMFQIAVPLVHNARLFALLGHCCDVDCYRPERLTPFGRTALRPCLFIIALQCAYVLLAIPEDTRISVGTSIGLMASMGLVAALFFLPLRGIRARIQQARRDALATLDARLTQLPPPGAASARNDELAEAAALIALRSHCSAVSSWPLGLEGVRRLFFYLVLVPLTWVGAALVQHLVEAGL